MIQTAYSLNVVVLISILGSALTTSLFLRSDRVRRWSRRWQAATVFLGLLFWCGVAYADSVLQGANGNRVNADASNNLNVTLPAIAQAGFAKIAGQDAIGVTTSGAFSGAPGAAATLQRLKVGRDSIMFIDTIDTATLNDNLWLRSVTAAHTLYTIAVSVGELVINNGNSTTANSSLAITTVRRFQRLTTFPIVARWSMKVPNLAVSCNSGASCSGRADNAFAEAGFAVWGSPTTSSTAQITDGCYFQFRIGGVFAVNTYNSTDTSSAALTNPSTSAYSVYMVVRKSTQCDYYINDVLVATVNVAAGNPSPASVSQVPLALRTYNATAGVASAAPKLQIGEVAVFVEDPDMTKSWGEQLAGTTRHASMSPVTTYLQTANHANSTSPVSATLSNTAAGYTTLGGRYQFAAPAGAATDFALFGFQVPSGYQLYVKGIAISTCNTGAAVATTATILDWGVAANSSAVSLATADTAAAAGAAQSWSPRRVPLGMAGFSLVAPRGPAQIGDCASDIFRTFDPPLVTESGRFFHVIVQVPVGTATVSQVIRGDVQINGYFE